MKMGEDFLLLIPVNGITSKSLANTLINTLDKLDIDLKYLRG